MPDLFAHADAVEREARWQREHAASQFLVRCIAQRYVGCPQTDHCANKRCTLRSDRK